MARIGLEAIRHAYGAAPAAEEDYALKRLDMAFEDGGAYALLGPSGCGKTTLLNIISGLVTPSEGRLLLDAQDVTRLPTQKRNIAQVFQFPVIYDTMTVRENLAFPLRNRGMKRADADLRVAEMLDMIGLTAQADRRARGLNADEKQKISLGRGLVRPDVAAILFDEPLTVIDPAMKWELRAQLKALHKRFWRTMIYVTHDQTEALTFADKVAVMHAGEVVQVGAPSELFDTPEHTFVGYFIGSPGMNILPAQADGDGVRVGSHRIDTPGVDVTTAARSGARLELGVRPEHVRLTSAGMPARISRVEDAGRLTIVRAATEAGEVAVVMQEGAEIPTEPHLTFDPRGVHVYADSRRVRGAAP